jgi:hypothetical protein
LGVNVVKRVVLIFLFLISATPSFAQIEVSSWSVHTRHFDKQTKRAKHYQFYTKEKYRQEIKQIAKDKCEILLHFDKNATGKVFYFYLDGWKDFDFYYQDPLTNEEKQYRKREPNVDGSYAIYFKGGMRGKFGHLYRPELVDVNGKKEWCDLEYRENGKFKITCPRVPKKGEILDPTLGYSTIGASENYGRATWGIGGFLVTGDASVTKVYAAVKSATTGKKLKIAVYDDSGGGVNINTGNPNNFVTGSSIEITVSTPIKPTQTSECAQGAVNGQLTSGVTYWLLMSTNNNDICLYEDHTHPTNWRRLYSWGNPEYDSFPVATMPAPWQAYDYKITVWADYSNIVPPEAISNLTCLQSNTVGGVGLVWTAPGADGKVGVLTGRYDIAYSTWVTGDGGNIVWSTATANLFITTSSVNWGNIQSTNITGLTAGGTYYFKIWTEDDSNNLSSISNTATGYAQTLTVRDGSGADVAYTYSNIQLQANWTLTQDATGYLYAIGTTAGGTNVVGWTINNNVVSSTNSALTLTVETTYYYSVKSVSGGVESDAVNSSGQFVNRLPRSFGYASIGIKDDAIEANRIECYGGAGGDGGKGTDSSFLVVSTPVFCVKVALWDTSGTGKAKAAIYTGTTGGATEITGNYVGSTYSGEVAVEKTVKPTELAHFTTFYFHSGSGMQVGTTYYISVIANSATMKTCYDTAITSYSFGTGMTYANYPQGINAYWEPLKKHSAYALSVDVDDATPPAVVPYVYDGFGLTADVATSTKQYCVAANWGKAIDEQSGILYYRYAVGTTAGGTDTFGWTTVLNYSVVTTSVTGALFGINSTTYYFTLKAVNGAGLESSATNSNGQWIDTTNSFKQTTGKFGNSNVETSNDNSLEDDVIFQWFCAEEDIIAKHLYAGVWMPDGSDAACGWYKAYPKFAIYSSSIGAGVSPDPAHGGLPGNLLSDFGGVWVTSTPAFGGNWAHIAINYTLTQGTTYWLGFSNCNLAMNWIYRDYEDGAIHSFRVDDGGGRAYPNWNYFPYSPAEMAWNDPTGGPNQGTTPAARIYYGYIHSIYLMGESSKKRGSNKIIIIGQ